MDKKTLVVGNPKVNNLTLYYHSFGLRAGRMIAHEIIKCQKCKKEFSNVRGMESPFGRFCSEECKIKYYR